MGLVSGILLEPLSISEGAGKAALVFPGFMEIICFPIRAAAADCLIEHHSAAPVFRKVARASMLALGLFEAKFSTPILTSLAIIDEMTPKPIKVK